MTQCSISKTLEGDKPMHCIDICSAWDGRESNLLNELICYKEAVLIMPNLDGCSCLQQHQNLMIRILFKLLKMQNNLISSSCWSSDPSSHLLTLSCCVTSKKPVFLLICYLSSCSVNHKHRCQLGVSGLTLKCSQATHLVSTLSKKLLWGSLWDCS